jgi:hypothetical protein
MASLTIHEVLNGPLIPRTPLEIIGHLKILIDHTLHEDSKSRNLRFLVVLDRRTTPLYARTQALQCFAWHHCSDEAFYAMFSKIIF